MVAIFAFLYQMFQENVAINFIVFNGNKKTTGKIGCDDALLADSTEKPIQYRTIILPRFCDDVDPDPELGD